MATEIDSFFQDSLCPPDLEENLKKIQSFGTTHSKFGRNIVLVSSGGTTVPLESRTIRFIDNFSVGTRGSASAEYFLEHGYAVIFLHRKGSLQPFKRHFAHTNFLDMLTLDGNNVKVSDEHEPKLRSVLHRHQEVTSSGTLLSITFVSLSDYLHLLKGAAQILQESNVHSMFYLAAAVSDFYIPSSDMPEHKIQSTDGPLKLHLQLVPKMLKPLVSVWATNAFVVSFKLETDWTLLVPKSRKALSTYRHQLVIGNILETRKREVVLVMESDESWIKLTQADVDSGLEIEQYIVKELIHRHEQYRLSLPHK